MKLVENNIPNGYRARVVHLHPNNSTPEQRQGHTYVTVCELQNADREVVGTGKSCCSSKDSPRRSVGRQVAIGRAMKDAGIGRD